MSKTRSKFFRPLLIIAVMSLASTAAAQQAGCTGLPDYAQLTAALQGAAFPSGGPDNGGFNLNMWGAVVNRDGRVCAVTRTGDDRGDQWPGSRVIATQKANTANAFSLPELALSTANLWAATQPGGSLFGLQFSNPVNTHVAYRGNTADYGTSDDPMVTGKIGGVNVFGGGLALYDESGTIVGALGVSGDSSCADHNIAWRTRDSLGLDNIPGGVSGTSDDNIIFDDTEGAFPGGFIHPTCGASDLEEDIAASLPVDHPIGANP